MDSSKTTLDLLSMSASSAWPTLGSEPRYVSEPHPQAEEESENENRMVNKTLGLTPNQESTSSALLSSGGIKEANLSASFEEKAFESRAGPHQRLDAILGDLITPGDVELLQQGTTLTDSMRVVKKKQTHQLFNNVITWDGYVTLPTWEL